MILLVKMDDDFKENKRKPNLRFSDPATVSTTSKAATLLPNIIEFPSQKHTFMSIILQLALSSLSAIFVQLSVCGLFHLFHHSVFCILFVQIPCINLCDCGLFLCLTCRKDLEGSCFVIPMKTFFDK